LDRWLPQSSLAEQAPYRASAARLLVSDYRPDDQLIQQPVDWPLDAPLARFGTTMPGMGDTRCGVVDGSDWAAVEDLAAAANQLTPWVSDGSRSAIAFRPLLPDESGC
jgi:hypothetical protein